MFSSNPMKKAQSLADEAGPLMDRASEHASELAQRVVDAVRDSSQQMQDQATRASDNTAKYIRNEPAKALLIAAATGAALMALASLMWRSGRR